MRGDRGVASEPLIVGLLPSSDSDAEELADLAELLRDDLLNLDVDSVQPLTADEVPEQAKGAVAVVAGWLAVNLGTEALRAVVSRVVAFATQHGKTIELTLGHDTLKVSGLSRQQQDRLIDEWLARQAASS